MVSVSLLIRVENSQTKLKSELWPLRKNSADGVLSGPSALGRWCGERAPDAGRGLPMRGGSSWWAETRALSAVFSASSALSPVRMEVCGDSTHRACLRSGARAPPYGQQGSGLCQQQQETGEQPADSAQGRGPSRSRPALAPGAHALTQSCVPSAVCQAACKTSSSHVCLM